MHLDGQLPLGVDPAVFASTYSTEQLLTTLYLENLVLKREGPQTFEVTAVEPPTPQAVHEEDSYALVREYLGSDDSSGPRYLVLTNDYPDVGHEYGNGFVHRRVKAYQDLGASVDVLAFGKRRERRVYEYDGVRVLSGYSAEMLGLLALQEYTSVSVHFLSPTMWNLLYPFRGSLRLVVFLHGYEADRWIRRTFDQSSAEDTHRAIRRSLVLQAFWQHVLASTELRPHFVFVSRWWRRLVEEDMEIAVPARRSSIIHNLIDTDLFSYVPKPVEQVYKILWVRSAASPKYGADLATRALERVRSTGHWGKYHVRIIGDGEHFSEFERSFGADPQVRIERRFASQDEIAALHKEYGLFLVPTRYDAQGVSRDEAMSSGLVPVTNSVAAIPEFVDSDCALLAGAEESDGLADGILRLADDPSLFLAMSQHAAQRARRQCGPAATVEREARLLGIADQEHGPW